MDNEYSQKQAILFTPASIGPITLRNRTIRSAAFEGMCDHNAPTEMLYDYHRSVAAGGIGMTTLAYASVTRNGLSFKHQLWMRPEIVKPLRRITDAIHDEGAKASIQLGHCGNMSHRSTAGQIPISASTGFNLYSPTFVRGMRKDEIKEVAKAFGTAVNTARNAGFDAVEIHAGHGYLISQFLSPYTNRRRDEYGGSLDNRMRFMRMCMENVMKAAGSDMAVIVKTNMRDGFKGGIEIDEGILIAQELERLGAHALVLSGGFVSKAPMYVMNRDGFTLLAMGFTGEKALKFKLDYINAFNQMEETIKNGGHHVPGSFREALLLAAEQQARIEEQQKMIEANRPKVLFAEAVETSQRSCLIGELAKILNQNGIEIGQNRLFQWLRDNGYLCKTGENYNLPTQRAMEMNLFEIKKTTINKPDGTILVTTTTKVTGKGQIYFINKFLREKQQKQAV